MTHGAHCTSSPVMISPHFPLSGAPIPHIATFYLLYPKERFIPLMIVVSLIVVFVYCLYLIQMCIANCLDST